MADEQQVSTPAAEPAAAPAVVETPVTPSVVEPSSPTPETVPAVETAPVESTEVENVLGDSAKPEAKTETAVDAKTETKPEVKTPEKPATETPEGDATKPEGEAPVLPVYEDFKLPEGINLDKEQLTEFTKVLGEIETGKLDHAGMQEAGQKLVDLATKATTDSISRLNDYYVQFHENQKKARLESLKKDPELGGEKFVDTVATLQTAIREYGGTEEQIAEFRKEVVESGLDASPALCRVLFNMQQKINKYTTEADNGNGGSNRIVPGARPAPSKVKDYQRFYSGSGS